MQIQHTMAFGPIPTSIPLLCVLLVLALSLPAAAQNQPQPPGQPQAAPPGAPGATPGQTDPNAPLQPENIQEKELAPLPPQFDGESELIRDREAIRIWVGGGIMGGLIDFQSLSAENSNSVIAMRADLGGIPSGQLGIQSWLDESAGFEAVYQGSYFGSIVFPLSGEDEPESSPYRPLSGQRLGVFAHRLEGAFRYRWFLGDSLSSVALGLKVGFILHNLAPGEHENTAFVDTTYFGPHLGAFAKLPLGSTFGIEADASGIFPFNVREVPKNSGQPTSPLGFQAGAAPYIRLTPNIKTKVRFDYRFFSTSFNSVGNRGLGNIINGRTFDQFQSYQLILEFLL